MKLKIESFTKVTFVSIIIIASDLIGPNDTTRTRFRRLGRRRQDMDMQKVEEVQMMEVTTEDAIMSSTTEVGMTEMEGILGESMSNSSSSSMMESSSSASSSLIAEESRGTRGIRGFLPGFNLGGGAGRGGGGLFGGLKGGGGGAALFSFGGGGKDTAGPSTTSGGNDNFPESPTPDVMKTPTPAGNGWGGWSQSGTSGGSGGSSSGGGLKGLFASFPGANLFGGGRGKGGRGRGPFRLFSKLNQDQPCAAGLSSLPILSRIPFIPQKRFPSFIPSGVNTCDATCDSGPGGGTWRRVPPTKEEQKQLGMAEMDENSCTYNWRDSLMGLPFLLFKCQCKKKCPPKRVRIGGLFSSQCENVSGMKTRCKCPYGQDSFKCTITILPISVPFIQRKKPYYCTCCKENASTPLGPESLQGGYDLGPSSGGSSPPVQEVHASVSTLESLGGYGIGGANSVEQGGAASTSILQKELPKGRPLGAEHLYDHL